MTKKHQKVPSMQIRVKKRIRMFFHLLGILFKRNKTQKPAYLRSRSSSLLFYYPVLISLAKHNGHWPDVSKMLNT